MVTFDRHFNIPKKSGLILTKTPKHEDLLNFTKADYVEHEIFL